MELTFDRHGSPRKGKCATGTAKMIEIPLEFPRHLKTFEMALLESADRLEIDTREWLMTGHRAGVSFEKQSALG